MNWDLPQVTPRKDHHFFIRAVVETMARAAVAIDYAVYVRQPGDRDRLIPAIQTHQAKLGRVPPLVATDGGLLFRQE